MNNSIFVFFQYTTHFHLKQEFFRQIRQIFVTVQLELLQIFYLNFPHVMSDFHCKKEANRRLDCTEEIVYDEPKGSQKINLRLRQISPAARQRLFWPLRKRKKNTVTN